MGNMLTIKQTVARAAAEGMPISEYTLRHWVKVGIIPSRMAGRSKYLIYYRLAVTGLGTGVPCHFPIAPSVYSADIE